MAIAVSIRTGYHAGLYAVLIRSIDIIVGTLVFTAGWFAIYAPPESLLHTIQWEFLIVGWGVALVLGGFLSGAGRAAGLWLPEVAGLALTIPGTLLYLVSRLSTTLSDIGTFVSAALVVVAVLSQLRRYIEIQSIISLPRRSRLPAAHRKK